MGYEGDMEEYHQEMKLKEQFKYKFTYTVPSGTYYANSMWGLLWEVYSHRFSHFIKGEGWKD